MKQKIALEILKNGHNVFLTGPAGSGKTYVLNQFIAHLKRHHVPYAVTASTGIAATHLSGRTIHSWSGMGVKEHVDEKEIKKLFKRPMIRKRLAKTHVLIIDEISMIHAHQLDLINKIIRYARESWEPFGGMQVVLAGDFFQLPPVRKKEATFTTQLINASQSWKELDLKVCYLSEQHRQTGDDLTHILNDIRNNTVTEETYMRLAQNHHADGVDVDPTVERTKLYTHNVNVDAMNEQELQKITGTSCKYRMVCEGGDNLTDALKNGCLAPVELILKKGALVMFVRNNFERGYANGTTGRVVDFDEDRFPIIETRDGNEIVVTPETWVIEEDGEVLAQITQLPLRLAWAITIHKSQGMTLDATEIDLRRCFEYGMGYVALSRTRTLQDVILLGLNETALKVDPLVLEKDQEYRDLSTKHEKEAVLAQKKKCDQIVPTQTYAQHKKSCDQHAELRKKYPHAYKPWRKEDDVVLRAHISTKTPIAESARYFGRQESAIRARVAKILQEKDLS